MALEEAISSLAQISFDTLVGPADQKEQRAAEQGKIMDDQSKWKITMDGDETTIKGPSDAIAKFHRQIQEGAQLKHHVSQVEQVLQGELQKVQNRENAYNRSPILSALANIAGNMAQAPKMPGVVQALGRSSVQLNPGPLAIQGQKMNILEALDQAHRTSVADERADFNQNLQLAEFSQRQTEEDRRVQHEQETGVAKIMGDFAKDAQSKTFDPVSARAAAATVIKDPKKIDALVKYYSDKQDRQVVNDQIRESLSEKKKKDEFDRQLILEDKRETARMNAIMTGASMKMDQKINEKLTIPSQQQLKDLASFAETDKYLDRLQKALNDPALAKEMGQLNFNKVLPQFAKETKFVELQNLLAHETPRILNMALRGGQGGASILRTEQGRAMLSKLGVMQDMTLDQAKAVIPNIIGQIHDNRMATMAETPRAHWEDYKGKEYQDLFGRDSGMIGGQDTTLSYDDYKKWKDAQK